MFIAVSIAMQSMAQVLTINSLLTSENECSRSPDGNSSTVVSLPEFVAHSAQLNNHDCIATSTLGSSLTSAPHRRMDADHPSSPPPPGSCSPKYSAFPPLSASCFGFPIDNRGLGITASAPLGANYFIFILLYDLWL
jgi:hypothetical protein